MPRLDQADADDLLAMEKRRTDDVSYEFPLLNQYLEIPLISADGAERFMLDLNRKGRIRLSKMTFQTRAYSSIILARLDIDGPPHRNPGETDEISCPHLHVYREGYDDRIAIPAPPDVFTNTADLYLTCHEFMRFCNVTVMPIINPGLGI